MARLLLFRVIFFTWERNGSSIIFLTFIGDFLYLEKYLNSLWATVSSSSIHFHTEFDYRRPDYSL